METQPIILRTRGPDQYALMDSGNGRKLERFGEVIVDRPEDQALWSPRCGPELWSRADAVFTGDRNEDGAGRWKRSQTQPVSWPCTFQNVRFSCRLTSFRHVGVFPEHLPHWDLLAKQIKGHVQDLRGSQCRFLNLFGYTGLASLIAAGAGAKVTHVDASRAAIGWSRDNQLASGMEDRPIRWICDDALKFARREVRRENCYDIVFLDPPKFGRGPKNETWHLFEDLPEMLKLCRKLLNPEGGLIVLSVYAIRASFLAFHELMGDVFGPGVESGELVLVEESGRDLSTSHFCRWSSP